MVEFELFLFVGIVSFLCGYSTGFVHGAVTGFKKCEEVHDKIIEEISKKIKN